MTKEEAFTFLNKLARGIAEMFGENCETVIHEFNGDKMTNVVIYNGHVSGRKAGSHNGILDRSLVDVSRVGNVSDSPDLTGQVVYLKGGRKLKSSTYFLRGDDYVYALGINVEITVMEQMEALLRSQLAIQGDLFESVSAKENNENSIDSLYENSLKEIAVPVSEMKKEDRLSLVRRLHEKGFFNIQKSVPFLSEHLGVSKYTIYKYIKEIEGR